MVGKKEMQWELAKIRELFIQRMTVDSDHHDRRRNDYNQAIFHYYNDEDIEWWNGQCADYGLPKRKPGDSYPCWDNMGVDMVLRCWDNAVRDYLTGRAPCAKVDAPMREGDSDA